MPYWSYILIFIFGLCAGSFLNSLLWRTRENLGIFLDRSMCIHCRRRINFYDNIPLISYFLLGGKCRNCRCPISRQYPIVELVAGLGFVIIAIFRSKQGFITTPEMVRDWIIILCLIFIFVYDLKHKEILDRTTLPVAFVLFLASWAAGWNSWQSMLMGILIGAGFFFFQYALSAGKWIGGGDIKFGILMGVILGWPNILVGLVLSYIIGALISAPMVLLKKSAMKSETPFGTYLTIGTFIAMMWGTMIVEWYVGLLR